MISKCTLIEPFYCKEDDTVVEVAKKLRGSTIRQIFVVDGKNYPIGLISTTDINNRVVAEGKDPKKIKAKEIMSKTVDVFKKDEEIAKVYKEMRDHKRLMSAIIDEKKKFIGMLTIGEALNCLAQK